MRKLLTISLIICINSVCAQPVAKVLSATPKTNALRNSSEITLSRGSSLEVGDTIVTGPGGLVNIKYENGTLVNIGDNSKYKILAVSPKSTDVQIAAELSKGKMQFKTTGKTNDSLKTPVIAMAITGTTAEVFVKSNKQTYFNLIEGRINNLPPGSYQATPDGIKVAAFPPQGHVATSAGAEGSISRTATTQSLTSESNNDSNMAEEVISTVGLIQTAQVAAQASTDTSTVMISNALADIALECISPF